MDIADRFEPNYELTVEQNERVLALRKGFMEMATLIDQDCHAGRETSLAITKLEEASFWAMAGISRE